MVAVSNHSELTGLCSL